MRLSSTSAWFGILIFLFLGAKIGFPAYKKWSTETSISPTQLVQAAMSPPQPNEALSLDKPSEEKEPFTGWMAHCPRKNQVQDCDVEKTIWLGKTRQRLVSITLRATPGSTKPGMMLHLPVGLYLPSGVTVQFEGNKPQSLEVQTCNAKGCYAGVSVSPDILASMNTAKEFKITFQNLARTNITVPVPLEGFFSAYRKIRRIG